VNTAVLLAEEVTLDRLTLNQLAERLGMKTPSLYNHVQGLPDLNAGLAALGMQRKTAYPRLKSSYSQKELSEIYTPTPEERVWAEQNTRFDMAHLGLLVLLKMSAGVFRTPY
jgi:predicted DNA-binding transcriptional regulator AlpA